MQMSDNQLLLDADMQELDQLEQGSGLSGEEKNNREQELREEIRGLADNLAISYGAEKTEE